MNPKGSHLTKVVQTQEFVAVAVKVLTGTLRVIFVEIVVI